MSTLLKNAAANAAALPSGGAVPSENPADPSASNSASEPSEPAATPSPSPSESTPAPSDSSSTSTTEPPPTSTPSSSSTTTSSTPPPESSTSTPPPTSTSSTSSTTTPPSTTSAPETSVGSSTSTGSQGTTVVYVTSTQEPPPNTGTSALASTSATDAAGLATSTAAAASGGLTPGGTIAVAVVVPVASRKAKKAAEEERRKEVEEYGFNPNNDPTLPGMAGVVAAPKDDSSGYRGWGTTSAGRKASTNLSSGFGGLAMSEGSGPGYHHAATPSDGTVQYSDGARPDSGEVVEPIGVLGAAPVAANNRNGDIHRGPSNASSAYSAANRSEASEESHMSAHHPSGGYYSENPYYGDMATHGAYGGDEYQPVIRDVQARRNTRIENPGVYPRQGNAGIAQNF
ncbi:uncharacterized protein N7515_002893 [Penicillium bovifimosum]|uniref:Uncharacterized protein n=1 Tax=Penicillium bovifimosum TaxID=126998 RepID=A0A9W9L9U6_9EURO|nr:uncharacterized protein N7515_002893 [Penicillium bovifimosum]KAJ5144106.1 hypothetical protein N7515_002893 [Penicillium bovifimosum]